MSDQGQGTSSLVVRLAARGDGVTEDGRFVAGAIPGDHVRPDGTILQSAKREIPPCRHFGDCGGCQLQHVPAAGLVDFALARVLEPLTHAGITPEEVLPVHLSPAHSRRRAAMRATRRDGKVALGFNAMGAHRIVDLGECPVLHPALEGLIAPLRAWLAPHVAERAAISVTMTLTDGGVDLLLGNLQAPVMPELRGAREFAHANGLARLSVTGPDGIAKLAQLADPCVHMGDVSVTLPPAAFLQATADGEAALVAAASAMLRGRKRVADLFAGCGTFTFPLARRARVTAVEGARAAITALQAAAEGAGVAIATQHRDLFRQPLSVEELAAFDGVVIDPPRAGASAQCANLALSRVPVIAAISCNPATFARDAAVLVKGGYRLRRLWPVAQFRWSTRVELAAEFVRRR